MTIHPEGYDFLPKEQFTFYSIEFLIPFILITLIIFILLFFFKKQIKKLIPFLELILFY